MGILRPNKIISGIFSPASKIKIGSSSNIQATSIFFISILVPEVPTHNHIEDLHVAL
jgi:hypothetical protein